MILLVRLSGIYAMGLLYELIVMIPMVLIWFGNAPVSVAGTVHVLLILSRSFLTLAAGSRGAAQIAYKARRLLVSQAAHLPLPLLLHQRYAHYHGRNGVQEKAREEKECAWQDYLRLCKAGGSRSYLETLHDANLANPFEAGSVERACDYAAEILLAQIAEQNRR